MEISENTGLKVTENLIMLERGTDELLLTNSYQNNPLYVPNGRKYIKKFLKSIEKLQTPKKIKETFPNDYSLLEVLLNYRIVISKDSEKAGHDKAEISSKKISRDINRGMSLYLLLTQSCNLGCIYCLNGVETYRKEEHLMMKEEVAYKSVEKCLEKIAPDGRLDIVFFGGEPLMNWPLAKKVIVHCEKNIKPKHKDKKIVYGLTTNLAHLPSDLLEWAKKYEINFLCDIDGPPDIHNQLRPFKNGKPSFKSITDNVKRIIDSGMQVNLRSTVTSVNQDHMYEISKLHKDLGGASSAFVPINPVNSDEYIFPEWLLPSPKKIIDGLTKIYKSKIWDTSQLFPFSTYIGKVSPGARMVVGCGAPYGNTPVVDVNGDVYPCIYLVGLKRFFIGNILDDNYPDTEVLDAMMDLLHVDNMEGCRECKWRYLCSGGCPVGKLIVMDNPNASKNVIQYTKKINCNYTKAVLEVLLWEMAEDAATSAREGATKKEVSDHHILDCK